MEKRKRRVPLVFISDDDDNDDEDEDVHSAKHKFINPSAASSPSQFPCEKASQDWRPLFVDKRICKPIKESKDVRSTIQNTRWKASRKWNHAENKNDKLQLKLWVDKYNPKNLADLAVHSKKVTEVRTWLEAQLHGVSKPSHGGSVLMLTGPTGSGKTAVVRILADMLKVDLCEWHAPIPTLWNEHLHHVNSGAPYMSKLQEFKLFLESTGKYPSLPIISQEKDCSSQSAIEIRRPKVLLLDDLPPVHNRESLLHLCQCLHSFAQSVRFPTLIVMSEYMESGGNGQVIGRILLELQEALQSAGAIKISFNPITSNSVRKILTKISAAEKYPLGTEIISLIAESCHGDIRHAICSLQFFCLGQHSNESPWDPGGVNPGQSKLKRTKISETSGSNILQSDPSFLQKQMDQKEINATAAFRDGVLSLFHALGKLLHNKRHKDKAMDSGSHLSLMLKDELKRHPLNMEEPEVILSQAYTESGVIAAFLHENLLDFVDDEAADDVAIAMSYLSDADCLLGAKSRHPKSAVQFAFSTADEIDTMLLAEVVAGSIAARGVLFANTHPAPRRWQSLRAPALRQVEWALRRNEVELCTQMWTADMWSLCSVSRATQAIEYEPYLKQMKYKLNGSDAWSSSVHKESNDQPETDNPELCEAENELSLSQEQQLLSGFQKVVEITWRADSSLDEVGMHVEDDIEEW